MAFDLLAKHHRQIWNCQSCSACQRGPQNPFLATGATPDRICPSYDKFRRLTYSAQGRLVAAKAVLENNLEPTAALAESLFACTLCGACGPERRGRASCCVDRQQVKIYRDFRADLVKAGLAPTEPYKKIVRHVKETGNRFGFVPEKSKRTKWAAGLDIPKKADIVFFAGCVASYRKKEIAQATAKILHKSGTPFTIIGDNEKCCGSPLVNSGCYDDFKAVAEHNAGAIMKSRAKKVVTSCACCYHTLKNSYPEFLGPLDFEVIHSTELFAQLIEAGKIKPGKGIARKLTYQDPCHLTRVDVTEGTLVEPPRKIINSIPEVTFLEMDGNGMYTQCCGRNPVETPELAANAGARRLKDAAAIGAEAIVTACSFCEWSLSKAAKDMKSAVKPIDMTILLAASLGI